MYSMFLNLVKFILMIFVEWDQMQSKVKGMNYEFSSFKFESWFCHETHSMISSKLYNLSDYL